MEDPVSMTMLEAIDNLEDHLTNGISVVLEVPTEDSMREVPF